METTPITSIVSTAQKRNPALWKAAQEMEASFLSEMLKSAGFGKVSSSFGGGAGEEQFASFLVDAQSRQLVRTQGFGIAEAVFESMLRGVVE